MSRPYKRKAIAPLSDAGSSKSTNSPPSSSRYPLRQRKEAMDVNTVKKARKMLLKTIPATSTPRVKVKAAAVPIYLTSSDDENDSVVMVKKPAPKSELAISKGVELVTIMKENKEKYMYLIKTLGSKHLTKMVAGVLYPESISVVEILTDVPLDKSKLMKLSRAVFKQIMSANKIAFNASDKREKYITLIDVFLKQMRSKEKKALDSGVKSSALVTEQMLSCLLKKNLDEYKKLENAKTSVVKAALLEHGVIVDVDLGKDVLLEKLYLVLFKKALTEKVMKKYDSRKSLMLANECCICMEKAIKTYIVPCGHVAMCDTCPATVSDCPVCRVHIQSVLPLYFA